MTKADLADVLKVAQMSCREPGKACCDVGSCVGSYAQSQNDMSSPSPSRGQSGFSACHTGARARPFRHRRHRQVLISRIAMFTGVWEWERGRDKVGILGRDGPNAAQRVRWFLRKSPRFASSRPPKPQHSRTSSTSTSMACWCAKSTVMGSATCSDMSPSTTHTRLTSGELCCRTFPVFKPHHQTMLRSRRRTDRRSNVWHRRSRRSNAARVVVA